MAQRSPRLNQRALGPVPDIELAPVSAVCNVRRVEAVSEALGVAPPRLRDSDPRTCQRVDSGTTRVPINKPGTQIGRSQTCKELRRRQLFVAEYNVPKRHKRQMEPKTRTSVTLVVKFGVIPKSFTQNHVNN